MLATPARRSVTPALLGLLALAVQLAPLCNRAIANRVNALYGDEPNYWALSAGRMFSLIRPPGYPLVIAATRLVTPDSTTVLFVVQCLATALVPPLLFMLLRRELNVARPRALFAALLAALSFTATSLSKRVLADSLLAPLALAVLLLTMRATRGSLAASVAAGGILAVGLLLKPIFGVWVVLATITLVIGKLRRRDLARHALAITFLPIVAWATVCSCNYARYAVFRYSEISGLTIVRYLVPATVAYSELRTWDDGTVRAYRSAWTPDDLLRDSTDLRGYQVIRARASDVLRSHPLRTAHMLLRDVWVNAPRPFAFQELTIASIGSRALTWAGKLATYAFWFAGAIGAACGLRDPSRRGLTSVLVCALVAFAAATSIAFWEGARLMYPVEWCVFALVALVPLGVERKTTRQP